MTIVGLLTLASFLIADFDRTIDFCFTSLLFFLAHYSTGCFSALTAIASILLTCTVTVFVRLHRSINIEVTERVVASRMVYYLSLAVISNVSSLPNTEGIVFIFSTVLVLTPDTQAFIVPFFFAMTFTDTTQGQGNTNALTLSMVASVVANVSGLMTGGLYLFLKSNTLSTIGPRDKVGEYERQKMKSQIRRFGNGEGSNSSHMMQQMERGGNLRRMDSVASLISDKAEEATLVGARSDSSTHSPPNPNPLRSNAVFPKLVNIRAPEPAQVGTSTSSTGGGHMRKRSYSLFPGNAPSIKSSVSLLPATTYSPNSQQQADPDNLKPPPSMGNLINRHRRDSSMVSSATVQIGLRLSNVNDIMVPPLTINEKPPNIVSGAESVYSLDCPEEKARVAALKRPSPMVKPEPNGSMEAPVPDETPKRDPVKDSRMKTLPPVPATGVVVAVEAGSSDSESEYEEQLLTLSPTVYNPKSPGKARLPSPKGVGFTALAKSNSTGSANPRSPRSPPVAPPRRTTGERSPKPTEAKDWI